MCVIYVENDTRKGYDVMIKKLNAQYNLLEERPVITLCGSTRFKNEFYECATELTRSGWLVLMPHIFSKADGEVIDDDRIKLLKDMHTGRMLKSDAIFVVNPGGYIGEHTKYEIDFARIMGLVVYYMEE